MPFFMSLNIILKIATYITVTSTACSLLEGAFIQQVFGDIIYFNKFNQLDIYVLLGGACLLLFYVTLEMYNLAIEISLNKSSYKASYKASNIKEKQ